MKRLSPYWILPLLHFASVAAAAFAVHYSNGINVRDFRGDYGLWMDLGDLGIRLFSFTRWAVPVVLLVRPVANAGKDERGCLVYCGGSGCNCRHLASLQQSD